jgi:hypothetical protein
MTKQVIFDKTSVSEKKSVFQTKLVIFDKTKDF